jgi:hypothetical protein
MSSKQKALSINILYNKNNEKEFKYVIEEIEGCSKRTAVVLKERIGSVKRSDIREHPFQCDIQFHLDYPSLANLCWARVNVLVNPGKYDKEVLETSLHHFDFVVFSNNAAMTTIISQIPSIEKKTIHIPIEKSGDASDAIKEVINETYDSFPAKSSNEGWQELWRQIVALLPEREIKKFVPPPIELNQCPEISVITLLYNRRKFFDIAAHNMLLTDYPRQKIQWILVDDSDDNDDSPSDKVIKFQNDNPDFGSVVYVPLGTKTSIGAKRNLGVSLATNDIILMMDDDDHYPQTSFRRRVSWLLSRWPDGAAPSCCGCATIAMYDLVKAVSAVNMPPLNLPIGARLSEATLTFYKSFWEERKFPEVNIAEGEEWIKGREANVMELPPQHIIVAFNHRQNSTSRKIPDRADKGCFWGFPKEYLEFVHKIAGMDIEWQDK